MCLLIVAWRVLTDTPLLIGANRDEYLDRPALSMTVLRDSDPRVLGGRDERSGGTWFAVNEHGVFAGLTNEPLGETSDPTKRTRGELPLALTAHRKADEAVGEFVGRYDPADYNGAWLMVGDRRSLSFIDFTRQAGAAEPVTLAPGIHVLENRSLTTASAKVERVTAALAPLGHGSAADGALLARVLADHTTAARPEGDKPVGITANCVHLPEYGTRSSCLVRYGEDPAMPPSVAVADGPPCRTPFVEAGSLWERATL
jgi:uncharacterized protein with NRDE domain